MDEQQTLAVLMGDIGAHGGAIQLGIFAATLVIFALAGLMANRLFGMLEEARLLFWRSSQHLEAARGRGGAEGQASVAERLAAAAAAHRRKAATGRAKNDLIGR